MRGERLGSGKASQCPRCSAGNYTRGTRIGRCLLNSYQIKLWRKCRLAVWWHNPPHPSPPPPLPLPHPCSSSTAQFLLIHLLILTYLLSLSYLSPLFILPPSFALSPPVHSTDGLGAVHLFSVYSRSLLFLLLLLLLPFRCRLLVLTSPCLS